MLRSGFPPLNSKSHLRTCEMAASGFFPLSGNTLAYPDYDAAKFSGICTGSQDSQISGIQDIR